MKKEVTSVMVWTIILTFCTGFWFGMMIILWRYL